MHIAGQLAGDAARAAVEPVAQRNPVALVAGAAAAGAVLALLRPWRWHAPRTATLLSGRHASDRNRNDGTSVPSVLAGILTAVPLGTWMSLLQWALRRSARTRSEPHAD